MKLHILILFCVLYFVDISGQKYPAISSKYLVERDSTIYSLLDYTWIANEGISYLSVLPMHSVIGQTRVLPREGEGVSNFSLMEGNLDFRFVVAKGRPGSVGKWRRARLTFDYAANFRMLLDESKPLTPWSNRVGVSLDFNLYNNVQKGLGFSDDSMFDEQKSLSSLHKKNFRFINLKIRAHHYSNGQPPGFWYTDSLDERRNDYISGDFSTNYLQSWLIFGNFNVDKKSLTQGAFIYQRDGAVGSGDNSALAFAREQRNAYGQNRFIFHLDYRSGPRKLAFLSKPVTYKERDGFSYSINRPVEYGIRYVVTYISDSDLSGFNPNNFSSNNLYRFSHEFIFHLNPLTHRSIGYFVKAYYGRDYLNIRYDSPIFALLSGLTFSFDKYYPFKFNNSDIFIGNLSE